MEIRGYPRLLRTSERARDQETAQRLWKISEDLTGIHFDFDAVAATH